jgi:hypothetical protein
MSSFPSVDKLGKHGNPARIGSAMTPETLIRRALDEVALTIGSAATGHQFEDDFVWTVMKRLDRVRTRLLGDIGRLSPDDRLRPASSEIPRVHPAVDEFLVRNHQESETATAGLPQLSGLSAPRQALVRLCQSVDYGHITGVHVRGGEPQFNPPPAIVQDIKLDGERQGRAEAGLEDFALQGEVCRMLVLLDGLKEGRVERIEVRAGIPRRIIIERSITEAPL